MIGLGRSNYFRFNHPSEAKFSRSILPTARISMAPIAFYPAVDNPEYFHMSAQDAGLGGEGAAVASTEDPSKDVPARKTPPSTLALRHCNQDQSPKNVNHKVFKLEGPASSDVDKRFSDKSTTEGSDSDEPPEVPPRSEGGDSMFSSSPVVQSSGSSSIGEYIYTKSEGDYSPKLNGDSSSPYSSPTTAVVSSSNGVTAVHNIMYRSLPPICQMPSSPESNNCNKSSSSSSSRVFTFSTDVSSSHQGASPCGSSSKPNASSSHTVGGSKALHSYMNAPPVAVMSSPPTYAIGPPPVYPKERMQYSTEDLSFTEAKKQQALDNRIREQQDAAEEQVRLEEILNMCVEYEKQQQQQQQLPKGTSVVNSRSTSREDVTLPLRKRSTSPPQTVIPNRIKTNGSLPRDNRSPIRSSPVPLMGLKTSSGSLPTSPSGLREAAEEEITKIFQFNGNQERNNSLTRNGNLCSYPPFPSVNTSPPPNSPRSPYENVGSPTNGYAVPQSPRTRIRTTFSKDRKETCEIFENKMVMGDVVPSPIAKISHDYSFERSADTTPPPLPRSPRIERGIIDTAGNNYEASVINNRYFVPVTPRGNKTCQSDTISSNKSSLNSSSNCSFSSSLDSKFKNKSFEEQMLKNIQESLNIQDVGDEIERLKAVKKLAIEATMDLKTKICELESQENESFRELEMERALVEGELRSTREKLAEEEERLLSLVKVSDQMEIRHQKGRKEDHDHIQECKIKLESAEDALEKMESTSEGDLSASTEEEKELLETLKAQHETVDAERKIFEDTEFSQMESEASRESEREELDKEISDLSEKTASRKEKISELESQMKEMTSSVCRETECLEKHRQELLVLIGKERMRVSAVDRQFFELERLGIMSPDHGRNSLSCSSGSDEGSTNDLSEKLVKLHLLDRSQDDLDRINMVSISSPLDCHDSSLGRKASATLMEIEKNRQLILAKQGTLAIDQERRRVEELKRRVAREVKLQWEEKKAREQREVNCSSLNSIGSEDSSMTSSDLHTESLSSDDIMGQRNSGENGTTRLALKMRNRDLDIVTSSDQIRPLSDASSFCGSDVTASVKFRDKPRNQQRPLTRYLPIRSAENFDLRHHIESAGHQIELCSSIVLSPVACRGYLHKLGSKFRTWQKRWFVFDRSKKALIYYSDKSESKQRGGAYFQSIEEVYVDHLHNMKSPNAKLTFCVKTHDRVFQLMASSPEAMRIWIDVIFTGAEAYNQFGS